MELRLGLGIELRMGLGMGFGIGWRKGHEAELIMRLSIALGMGLCVVLGMGMGMILGLGMQMELGMGLIPTCVWGWAYDWADHEVKRGSGYAAGHWAQIWSGTIRYRTLVQSIYIRMYRAYTLIYACLYTT